MSIEILQPRQKDEAVDVLRESFRDYPLMRFVFQDAGAAYDEHLWWMIDYLCESRFKRGWPVFGLREDGRLMAVAVVSSPGRPPVVPELDRLYKELKRKVGEPALVRMQLYDELTDRQVPQSPHHYLGMIGVVADRQRRGYGKRLVEAVQRHAEAHPSSEGVSLNTESEANLPFYKRMGFRLIAEADFANLHTWCFFWSCTTEARRS